VEAALQQVRDGQADFAHIGLYLRRRRTLGCMPSSFISERTSPSETFARCWPIASCSRR
jgi:hypothetical protein